MPRRFGKLHQDTAWLALESLSTKQTSGYRAFLYLVPSFTQGGRLKDKRDKTALDKFLQEAAPWCKLDDVQVVAVSMPKLADELFGGTRGSAQNAMRHLTKAGILQQIAQGARGHAGLYVVHPLPEKPEDDGDEPP